MTLGIDTFLLQWATGGLAFLWLTTRRREVSIGYGWVMRITFGLIALGSLIVSLRYGPLLVRDISAAGVVIACAVAGWVSWDRRGAGVKYQRERTQKKSARVAQMTGIDRAEQQFDADAPEFPPSLDLIAPAIGLVGVIAGGVESAVGDTAVWLSVARTVTGAAFLGSVSAGMLLGHWYLTQPGLPRAPLIEIVKWIGYIWPFEVALLLVPPGMISAFNGTIDDGYNGMLAWFWAACAVTTIVLVVVTRMALKERYYSAVMAATGLLYLAILTAFGTDLVARAIMSMA
ncbi:MAG TPA: hypothetical protein VL068_05880 [Microthrixaceae bacterium]|nr:hypothetical protein [Microthrixaceae bacterium]